MYVYFSYMVASDTKPHLLPPYKLVHSNGWSLSVPSHSTKFCESLQICLPLLCVTQTVTQPHAKYHCSCACVAVDFTVANESQNFLFKELHLQGAHNTETSL